jgi:Mitochondrial import 2
MFETSDSYILQDAPPESSNDQDEIDSLPSSIVSSDLDSEEESDAQKEWEASLQQLELLLTMVVVPYIGKYFGRNRAFWSEFSCKFFESVLWLIMVAFQVGRNIWSGCTRSKSAIQARQLSRQREQLRLRHFKTDCI